MRDWLVMRRKALGLTQTEVAEKCDISQGYYSMIENDERGKAIPLNTAQRIAKIMKLPVERFSQDNEKNG